MRVGLDLLFLEPGNTGGRETYARELTRALREVRPDIELVGFGGPDLRGDGWWREVCSEVHELRGARPSSRPRWARGELAGLARAAARARVDVVHGLANFGPVTGPFARVVTAHDVLFAQLPEAVPWFSRVPTSILMKAAAKRADLVLTGTYVAAGDVARTLKLDRSDVVVVPHGIAPPPAHRGDAARGRELAGRDTYVLSVASHLPHKNLTMLDDEVVKVGPGTEVLPGGLGAVDQDDLEALYAGCAAMVMPTLAEGFGLPVLEAMLRGVPVACSDLPVLREVAGRRAELFPAGDAEACRAATARAVARGRDDPTVVAYAATFTWARAAQETAGAYERALSSRR